MNSEIPRGLSLSSEELIGLMQRLDGDDLTIEDREQIRVVLEGLLWLMAQLEEKKQTVRNLLHPLMGKQTESSRNVLKKVSESTDHSDERSTNEAVRERSAETKGHGKRPYSEYPGAQRVFCPHKELTRGCRCPGCCRGSLHRSVENGFFVRFVGQPMITATIYETEKIRCNLCGAVYEASLPADVPAVRWDETAKSITAILRYGYGVPHYRQEKLQSQLGIPIADSVLFALSEQVADAGLPVYKELVRLAAQGNVLHSDDTFARVLSLMKENEYNKDPKARKGIFTTAFISKTTDGDIALFFTGRNHAGENLEELLKRRAAGLDSPIVMTDASSRNLPDSAAVVLANCVTHARRQFVKVYEGFPDEVTHIIQELAKLYHHEQQTQQVGMNAQERLAYHQEHSAPILEELKSWVTDLIVTKKVEPNSGLGKAIAYLHRHWTELTRFLQIPGAPMSNDLCEQLIKRCVLHRKASMFYKNRHGAAVGDTLMTLIHTAIRSGVNPFDYLTKLQRHVPDLRKNPSAWLPWNYRQTLAQLPSLKAA